jgi:hypothetical protein
VQPARRVAERIRTPSGGCSVSAHDLYRASGSDNRKAIWSRTSPFAEFGSALRSRLSARKPVTSAPKTRRAACSREDGAGLSRSAARVGMGPVRSEGPVMPTVDVLGAASGGLSRGQKSSDRAWWSTTDGPVAIAIRLALRAAPDLAA